MKSNKTKKRDRGDCGDIRELGCRAYNRSVSLFLFFSLDAINKWKYITKEMGWLLKINAAQIGWCGNLLTLRAKFLGSKCLKPALLTVNMPADDRSKRGLVGL